MLRLPVRVIRHKKRKKGREYEWVERRINLPADFPDVPEVLVLVPGELQDLRTQAQDLVNLDHVIDLLEKITKRWISLSQKRSQTTHLILNMLEDEVSEIMRNTQDNVIKRKCAQVLNAIRRTRLATK